VTRHAIFEIEWWQISTSKSTVFYIIIAVAA